MCASIAQKKGRKCNVNASHRTGDRRHRKTTELAMDKKLDAAVGCWPSTTQEYLLKAVLLKDEMAHTAWHQWLSHVDFLADSLRGGSYQLLPLLTMNLQASGVDDPLLGRLRGIVRNTWTRNQIQIQNATPVLQALDNNGIRTLLLNRAALILAVYKDFSLCLIDAIDLLVPPEDIDNTQALILDTGVWFTDEKPLQYKLEKLRSTKKITFHHQQGHRLNLHLHLPLQGSQNKNEHNSWAYAVPFQFQNIKSHTLCPTDQVLALCLDGLLVNRMLAVDWIVHVANIINQEHNDLDWQRLNTLAQQYHFVFAVRNILHYLKKTLDICIPESQLEALDNLAVHRGEKREWDALIHARTGNGFRYSRLRRLSYSFAREQALSNIDRFNPVYILAFYQYLRRSKSAS
jgi:hypothetical protein